MIRTLLGALAVASLAALGACTGSAQPGATAALHIAGEWTSATPQGAPTAAGYLTITNNGQDDDRLVAVASPMAASAMLHRMEVTDGIASMRMVDGIDIPAGKTVTLAPDGFHIMFVTLAQPLKAGDSVPVTLTFARAGKIDITLPVLPLGAKGPPAP